MCVDRFYALNFRIVKGAFQNIHYKNGVLSPIGMRTTEA